MAEIDENFVAKVAKNTKEAIADISKEINGELGRTFTELAQQASEKSRDIAENALQAQRKYTLENERLQDSKKKAQALYVDSLKDNVERIKALRDDELCCLKNSYELGLISTEEYFARLGEWRDRYFENGTADWQKYTAEILSHNKKLADEQQKALSNAASVVSEHIKKQYDALIKEQEQLEDKLSDKGSLLRRNRLIGENLDLTLTLPADMDAQIAELEEYGRLIGEVQNQAKNFWRTDGEDQVQNEKNAELRSKYFEKLRDMSMEDATDLARALLNGSEQRITNFYEGFARKQELVEQISKDLFSTEIQDAADSAGRRLGDEFGEALSDELEGLSGKFFTSGEEACKSFSDGFMANIQSVLAGLSAEITAGAAAAMSTGIEQSIENNTSYNIYGATTPGETIRLLREKEEMKQLMME